MDFDTAAVLTDCSPIEYYVVAWPDLVEWAEKWDYRCGEREAYRLALRHFDCLVRLAAGTGHSFCGGPEPKRKRLRCNRKGIGLRIREHK